MYYIKGPVRTNVRWTRPTHEKFNAWFSLVRKYIEIHQIDIHVYLLGGFLSHPEDTWDIDIQLTHPNLFLFTLKQLKQIRDLMIYAMQIGHDEIGRAHV